MRIVRPGMVVGPQQQYMLENQMKWVSWVSRTGEAAWSRTDRSGRS